MSMIIPVNGIAVCNVSSTLPAMRCPRSKIAGNDKFNMVIQNCDCNTHSLATAFITPSDRRHPTIYYPMREKYGSWHGFNEMFILNQVRDIEGESLGH